jgi:hypothetical protein
VWLYLLWHSPRAGIATAAYERRLRAYHAALATHAAAAGVNLIVDAARVGALPWRPPGGRRRASEAAYAVRQFADLDRLRVLAAAGPLGTPHDAVAVWSAHVQAGLYGLVGTGLDGGADGAQAPLAVTWLVKPAGMPYALFEAAVATAAGGDHRLWRRALSLSPAPEYRLETPRPPRLVGPLVGPVPSPPRTSLSLVGSRAGPGTGRARGMGR